MIRIMPYGLLFFVSVSLSLSYIIAQEPWTLPKAIQSLGSADREARQKASIFLCNHPLKDKEHLDLLLRIISNDEKSVIIDAGEVFAINGDALMPTLVDSLS